MATKVFARSWLENIRLYLHTVRDLRLVQVYGRAFFNLRNPKPDFSPAPRRRLPDTEGVRPAVRKSSLTGPQNFLLLAQDGSLDDIGWDGPQRSKLWRYNQHYFDDLNASESEARRDWHVALLHRWVRENPAGVGSGWEPYPTSLRIVNWVKWTLAGNELPSSCIHSMAVQIRWLMKRLEYHLLGNHLLVNAKALVFAGLFFEGAEADSWRRRGFSILRNEIREQVLPDGGHFERSTMYHALVLEDVLDLCNISRCFVNGREEAETQQVKYWCNILPRMLHWLAVMRHPDGEISLFNDAALGIAATADDLLEYAARLGFAAAHIKSNGIERLEASGYARMSNQSAVALVDMAPLGPAYLPAHGHADTLSFELSLFGDRCIVDTGCSTYEVSEERLRQRGTAAHNTVIVDGQDSSEVWSSFRVARRAKPLNVSTRDDIENMFMSGAHDGYERLKGRVKHTRSFTLSSSRLEIADRIDGQFRLAEANFLLHPEVEVVKSSCGLKLRRGNRTVQLSISGGTPKVKGATWHPEFGSSIATQKINVLFLGDTLVTTLTWDPD